MMDEVRYTVLIIVSRKVIFPWSPATKKKNKTKSRNAMKVVNTERYEKVSDKLSLRIG